MESWSTNSSASGLTKLNEVHGNTIPGVLPQNFYARNTLTVARELLGKLLVVRSRPGEPLESPAAGLTAGRIVETEVYHGDDPASHSCRGQTARNSVMFGEAGVAYIYFIYGMYEMLNFVTEKKGYPGAVLIRAVEPVFGEALMARRRKSQHSRQWASGPGKLCRAMGIKMKHYGEALSGPSLFVVDDGCRPREMLASPRVGINVGTEQLWRFFVKNNPFVSRVRENAGAVKVRNG